MALVMLIALAAPAQQGISYQAALRNAQGEPMANREVRLRLTLREGATDRYAETQTVTTTALGLINVVVGEGTPVSGDFGQLDWSHQYDLVVEIDAELSGSYAQLQASALHPVPQAQWARVASELQMPESRGLTLQPKPTAQLHEDSVLFGVRNKNGDLVFAVYNSGVAVYVDDRDNGSRPQRAGFMVGGMDGTRNGTQRTLFAVDGTGTQVLVDEGTGGRPQRAGFRVGGMDGTRDGERAQRNLFEVDASGTRVHVDGRDATGRPQRAGFRVGGMDGTRAGSTLLTVDSSGTSVFIDDATTAGRPQRAGFRVGGMDGTRAGQQANYFVVTSDSTRVYVDERNRPQRAGFAVGGMDGTRATSDYMNITKDNYIIGHGAGDGLNWQNSTGKYNSIMGSEAGYMLQHSTYNTLIGYQSGYNLRDGHHNVFIGPYTGGNVPYTLHTVAIGHMAAASGTENSEIHRGVFIGYMAGHAVQKATDNVIIGSSAGRNHQNGNSNVFVGESAGQSSVQSTDNIVLGSRSARNATHMERSIIVGVDAGSQGGKEIAPHDNYHVDNIIIGHKAGYSNKQSENNIFMGTSAGYTNSTGKNNVFMGTNAGYSNNNGENNVFLGNKAGYFTKRTVSTSASQASNNVFIGTSAGESNEWGYGNVYIGESAGKNAELSTHSIFIGQEAGSVASASYNVFIGRGAGKKVSTGGSNIFMGDYAGGQQETGNNNVFIGDESGWRNLSGNSNVFIGCKAGYNETGSNKLYIANGSLNGNTYKTLIYGEFDNNIVKINGQTVQTSDRRLKTDIRPLENALAKVLKLNGVNFKWIPQHGIDSKQHVGVIAQEVEAVLPEAVVTHDDGYKSVSYNELTPLLIEAIKEQQQTIEKQQQRIEKLEQLVEQLLKK